jgi:hypothetical protein
MATPLVEATAVPDLMMLLGAATVVVPSAFRTMLFEPELGFLRLVVESVLIGSLVKDVDRPGVERVGWSAGSATNDADAVQGA